eukprot:scaffold2212_cov134-Isochrysis_galbana.AAC.1
MPVRRRRRKKGASHTEAAPMAPRPRGSRRRSSSMACSMHAGRAPPSLDGEHVHNGTCAAAALSNIYVAVTDVADLAASEEADVRRAPPSQRRDAPGRAWCTCPA